MGKKLKVPAGGVAGKKQQPAAESQETAEATPTQPTVADQATALLEAADDVDEASREENSGQAVHILYVTGDKDAPASIVDRNDEVVLGMCRVCGRAEAELSEPCRPQVETAAATEPEIADADVPVSPSMVEQPAAAETPNEPPAVSVTQEQWDAWKKALSNHSERHYEWQRDVNAAKEKHTAAAIARSQADDARKAAKSQEDDDLESLMKLLSNEPKEPTFAEVVAKLARKRPVAAASDRPADSSSSPVPANTSDAWRAVAITKLDLPDKLIERLQEAGLDTMGRLEDRRAEIALGKEKWPKGIGEAKITKIEDAVVAWLTANRDQAAFSELQSGHASEQPAEPAVDGEAKGEGEINPVPLAHTDQIKIGSEAYADFINARALELDTDQPGALADDLGAGYWDQGWAHYEAGGELRACELPSGSRAQDDFIRGWLSAGNLKDREDAGLANNFDAYDSNEEPPAGEEPELQEVAAGGDVDESSAGPVLFNPDDI